jgi:hypothetical protein
MSSIIREFKRDLEVVKKWRIPWWGMLCLSVVIAPIVFFLNHVGRLDLALPILGSLTAIGLVVVLKWRLRQRAWFWITIVFVAAAHVPLIMSNFWTTNWVPWPVTGAIASLDFCFMLGLLLLVELFMDLRESSKRR